MKKFIVAGVMALGFLQHLHKTKSGISADELIGVMPEAEKADAELKEYQASLAQQGQDMMKELNDKDSLVCKDSAKLSPSMKEIKKNELISLYQRVQGWNQQAQEMYQQEAPEKNCSIAYQSNGSCSVQLPKKVVIAMSSISIQ
jgi:hypothetical protein